VFGGRGINSWFCAQDKCNLIRCEHQCLASLVILAFGDTVSMRVFSLHIDNAAPTAVISEPRDPALR
jgi:hypothetical protein